MIYMSKNFVYEVCIPAPIIHIICFKYNTNSTGTIFEPWGIPSYVSLGVEVNVGINSFFSMSGQGP